MLRRCLAPMLLLSVVATLALRPSSVRGATASSTSPTTTASTNYGYYELVNNRPTTLSSLIVTNVIPPNAIAPPDASTSPLTILDGSFGFDPKNLQVFLSPSDPKVQGLAINFANGGLASGGTLNFKVSLAPGFDANTPPQLQLQDPDTDLKLVQLPPPATEVLVPTPDLPATQVPTPTPTVENTPEPVSIALWSTLAGIGVLRARAFRRGRHAPAA